VKIAHGMMSGYHNASFGRGRGSVSQAPAVTHRSAPLLHRRAPLAPAVRATIRRLNQLSFFFCFSGRRASPRPWGWLFLAFAALRAAYGRRTETLTPMVEGRLYAPCSKAKAPNSGDISPLGRPGDCLMDKGFRAVDNCKRKRRSLDPTAPPTACIWRGRGKARAAFTYFFRGQTEGARV
jgi:hypothetical protein